MKLKILCRMSEHTDVWMNFTSYPDSSEHIRTMMYTVHDLEVISLSSGQVELEILGTFV